MNHYPPAILPSDVVAAQNGRRCIFWGWFVVGGCCLLAIIPYVGLLAWFIGPPLLLAGAILAIIGMANSHPGHGLFLLVFTMIGGTVTVALGPLISSFLASVLVAASVEGVQKPAGWDGFPVERLEYHTPGR